MAVVVNAPYGIPGIGRIARRDVERIPLTAMPIDRIHPL
jgi:hypothetical protein